MHKFSVAACVFVLACASAFRLPVVRFHLRLHGVHTAAGSKHDARTIYEPTRTLTMRALPVLHYDTMPQPVGLVSIVGARPAESAIIGSNVGRNSLGSRRMHTVAPRMDDGLKVFFFYGVTFSIIAALAYVAVLYGNYEKAQEWKRFVKEANRDKELRENMFFEAVDDIEKKIANPKLGKKKKAILQSQLKDLDPLGQIRGFLQGNGSRPVLADESEISPTEIAKVGAHSRFGRPKQDTSKKNDDDENVPGDAVPLSIYNIEEDNELGEAGKIRKLLQTLEDFLEKEDCMKPKRRVALITKLSRSFAEVYYNEAKRAKAVQAVEAHLKDEEYWVRYANKVLK